MSASRRAMTALASVVAVVTPVGLSSAAAASPTTPTAASSLARSLGADRPMDVSIARSPSTGLVRFIGTTAGHPLARPAGVAGSASSAAVAAAFLREHSALFGIGDPETGLVSRGAAVATSGVRVARFGQQLAGVPVLGGEISVAVTPSGQVAYVSADTAPDVQSLGTARITAAQAREVALLATARAERVATRSLRAGRATTTVYDPAVVGVPTSAPTSLAYRVDVDARGAAAQPIRELVLVDAVRGAPLLAFNQVEGAAAQNVCTAKDRPSVFDPTCPPDGGPGEPTLVPSPSDPNSGTEIYHAYAYAAATYDFYRDVVGNASKIGLRHQPSGRELNSTVRFCDPAASTGSVCAKFENAFWDGHEMVYGDGMTSADDVVAHELTHGVTEHTSNLMYLYQSGAINESMSDVMGELMDQWHVVTGTNDGDKYRWMIGEDLPARVGVLRDMKDPTRAPSGVPTPDFTPQPAKMTSALYFAAQDDDLDTGQATPVDNGGVHVNSGVGNKAAYLVVDGGSFNGVTVPGLGGKGAATRPAAIEKAARIYYLADRSLTSGADYQDLSRVLPAACAALVGSVGITTSDCATVRAAVRATEMAKQPKVGAAPEAPTCPTGSPRSTVWYDNLENPASGRWKKSAGGPGPWYYPASKNVYHASIVYATSGTHQLFGDDVDPQLLRENGIDAPRQGSIAMTHAVVVPKGKRSFLRFNHAYLFEWYRSFTSGGQTVPPLYADGGKVEYTVDNGKHWLDAGPLLKDNGYNHTMRGFDASQQKQIYKFRGFGGDSHGYVSSRAELTSLAGKSVRFRFHVINDATIGGLGWNVDDVRVYGCGPRPSAPTRVSAGPGAGSLTVSWRAPSDHGTTAITGYRVTVKSGSATLASVTTGASARRRTVTGLPSGKSVTAYVAAVNSAGAGPAGRSTTLRGSTLHVAVSATAIKSGAAVKLSGRLVKAGTTTGLGGRRVSLYRAAIGSATWTRLSSKTTGKTGSYAFTRTPPASSRFQVRFAGGRGYQGAVSATHRVTVS